MDMINRLSITVSLICCALFTAGLIHAQENSREPAVTAYEVANNYIAAFFCQRDIELAIKYVAEEAEMIDRGKGSLLKELKNILGSGRGAELYRDFQIREVQYARLNDLSNIIELHSRFFGNKNSGPGFTEAEVVEYFKEKFKVADNGLLVAILLERSVRGSKEIDRSLHFLSVNEINGVSKIVNHSG